MKKNISLLLCIGWGVIVFQEGQCQLFSPAEIAIRSDLLRLKTHSAAVQSFTLQATPESSPIHVYLLNYRIIIGLLATDIHEAYEHEKEFEAQCIRWLKPLMKQNDYAAQWAEALVYLQWAVVKLKYSDNFSAFWGFRKGYQALKRLEERFPNQVAHKLWLGTMQVMLEKVPNRYHWLLQLLGLQGNAAQGWNHIEKALQNSEWNAEAIRYKAFLQMFVLNEETTAYETFQELYAADSSDMLSLFALCQLSQKLGKAAEVLPLLEAAEITEAYGNLSVFHYFEGLMHLQQEAYGHSIESLHMFLQQLEGNNYRKDAHYRLFLAYWLQDVTDSAAFHLEAVRRVGSAHVSADQYALQFAQKGHQPHKRIMRARLLTDGGYYTRALQVIDSVQPAKLPPEDAVEFTYRKARIYHRMQRWEDAIRFYQSTLKLAAIATNDYFAPNAALQVGIIFAEQKNDSTQANVYFKKVLAYSGAYPYRNSLRDQAKNYLKRLTVD